MKPSVNLEAASQKCTSNTGLNGGHIFMSPTVKHQLKTASSVSPRAPHLLAIVLYVASHWHLHGNEWRCMSQYFVYGCWWNLWRLTREWFRQASQWSTRVVDLGTERFFLLHDCTDRCVIQRTGLAMQGLNRVTSGHTCFWLRFRKLEIHRSTLKHAIRAEKAWKRLTLFNEVLLSLNGGVTHLYRFFGHWRVDGIRYK